MGGAVTAADSLSIILRLCNQLRLVKSFVSIDGDDILFLLEINSYKRSSACVGLESLLFNLTKYNLKMNFDE